MSIAGDRVTLSGITKTKNELKDDILRRLDYATDLPEELEEKLLEKVKFAID